MNADDEDQPGPKRELRFANSKFEAMNSLPPCRFARQNSKLRFASTSRPPDIAIAFNPSYLMDPLKALGEDEVFLELIDDLSPGIVKTNGPFLYVIMPMRMS